MAKRNTVASKKDGNAEVGFDDGGLRSVGIVARCNEFVSAQGAPMS